MIKYANLLFVSILFNLSVYGAVIAPQQGGGGTTSGSITGAYSFAYGFTTSNVTNVFLLPAISNLAVNLPMTNNWNSWVIYGSPTVSNSMFAANRGLGIVTNSTSFSGLIQSIVNRGVEGFHIEIMPNPYYSNSYSADATITITNWGIIQGHGNPVTVIRGAAALNGPIFQVGTTTIGANGINRFKDIRLEGDNAGVNGVGIKIVNSAEPVFRDMETTGFKLAGIELASTQYVHWAYADHCWFVAKNAGAVGILVSGAPISSDRAQNHFDINDCNFGVFGGGESISVTADFPNLRVTDSVFKYASGTMNYGIQQLNGRDASYSGNKFVNFSAATPITFAASGGLYTGVTNLNPTFVNNHSDGTGEIITLGQFVTNVTLFGNSIRGSGATVLYEDVTSNGRISNFDPTELRLGSLSTNALLMTDAYGMVKTTALSGLTLSGGTLTASGGSLATNANQFGASTTLTLKDGVLTTNALNQGNFTNNSAGASFLRAIGTANGGIEAIIGGTLLASLTTLNGVTYTNTTGSTIPFKDSVGTHSSFSSTGAVFNGHVTVASNITAQSFIGSGAAAPVLQLFATNNNAVVMGIANSNSVMITNLVGQLHKANAVYIELDCNHGNDFHITNRIAQNTIVNWLNPAQGQTLSLRLHGAVSGGTDYFVTNTFPTSWLVANQSSNSAPVAIQLPVSVLDGTGAELNIRPYRLFTGSTNIAGAIINTYTE